MQMVDFTVEDLGSVGEQTVIKSYREYEHKFEIIDKEKFSDYHRRKIKKAWWNLNNKLCKKSFIYLGDDNKEPGKIVAVDVINGVASKKIEDRYSISLDDLFKDSLIFVGYMEDSDIGKELPAVISNAY